MALSVAIDANRYADYLRGLQEAVDVFTLVDAIFLPVIVVAELRAGFRGGTRAAENEKVLTQFLRRDRVSLLSPDEATTHHYAALYVELRRAGTPIPTNDLWIAALVVQHGLVLYSRDRHFDCIPRIPRI